MKLPKHVSVVEVSEPVDGTRQRRRSRGARKAPETLDRHVRVDPAVMAAVRRMKRPGQRLVIQSSGEVWLVNNGAAG